jgi:hypothetical protein
LIDYKANKTMRTNHRHALRFQTRWDLRLLDWLPVTDSDGGRLSDRSAPR